MINNVAKLFKNVNSLHQAEIAARHTSHEKNKQIHCFGSGSRQEICFEKKTQKQQKHMIFKKAAKSATQKKWKKHAWCPKIKQVHRHAKRAQSNFFVKKSGKNLFFERQLRAPHENSRNFGKNCGFDIWQSQKKSVISWFLDSGTEILLGKRKVVRCCSFLLWCS